MIGQFLHPGPPIFLKIKEVVMYYLIPKVQHILLQVGEKGLRRLLCKHLTLSKILLLIILIKLTTFSSFSSGDDNYYACLSKDTDDNDYENDNIFSVNEDESNYDSCDDSDGGKYCGYRTIVRW